MAVGHEAVVEARLPRSAAPRRPSSRSRGRRVRPVEVALDEEDRELLLLAGLGEHGEEVGHRRRGDPGLLAVEHVAAVDLLRAWWRCASRSLPAFGSVMQMAPIFSPRSAGLNSRSRMSALPSMCRNLVPISDCIAAAAGERHRAARDLLQREAEFGQRRCRCRRRPPDSACRRSPSAASSPNSSRGNACASSSAAACGAMRSSQKRAKCRLDRAAARRLRSKSMAASAPLGHAVVVARRLAARSTPSRTSSRELARGRACAGRRSRRRRRPPGGRRCPWARR